MESRILRPALERDIDTLFRWANEKSVREHAFSTEYISYEDHKKWFENIIKRDDAMQYIYMQGSRPVGQARVNVAGEEAEIDYSIDARYRNQGHGKHMLDLLREQVRHDYPKVRRLTAKVKPDNPASHKVFLDTGYRSIYSLYAIDI